MMKNNYFLWVVKYVCVGNLYVMFCFRVKYRVSSINNRFNHNIVTWPHQSTLFRMEIKEKRKT